MNEDNQTDADALLKAVKQQESTLKKAKLKIFFAMAAGSGKTYAMLQGAQVLKKNGIDVIVGLVNTHGRSETAALLNGLKVIPEKPVEYKGIVLTEFDIDEVLRLKPQVVLVDELAHTNVPGSRHPKRWQDVKELLENGIDVHTTLNVQHVESLKDIVEGIAGITIRETVPDSIIEEAASIELIDITTDELLQRLKEGKVYLGDKSEVAAKNFFQEDRLTALREIALRYAAEKVDHELQGMVTSVGRLGEWKPRERLLIAVSQSPYSQKLIRMTRRLASNLHSPWIAAYIDDGSTLSIEDNNLLTKNLALARDLGAEIIVTNDSDIADGIKRIAKQRGVTQIILGRPPRKRFLGLFDSESIVDRLSRECIDIDIHVIRQEMQLTRHHKKLIALPKEKSYSSYIIAIITVAILGGLNWFLLSMIGYKVIGVIFLVGILGLSLFLRKGPIFLATFLSGFIWDFFFVPPTGSLEIDSTEDAALLIVYLLTAISTGILVDRARQKKDILEKREKNAQALYDIIRNIANTRRNDTSFDKVKEKLGQIFAGTFDIVVKTYDGGLPIDKSGTLLSDEKEKNACIWVFEHGKEAGWSTDTLPLSQNLYIPMVGLQDTVGVLIFRPKLDKVLSLDDMNFLFTVTQQLAKFFERRLSDDKIKRMEENKQMESMHTMILNRILHVLQHPISVFETSIVNIKILLKPTSEPALITEINKIEKAKENLKIILTNVSEMANLSGGFVSLDISLHNIKEVVNICCKNVKDIAFDHILTIKVEDNLPLVPLDVSLIEVLLFNLMTNAIYYSPKKSTVLIEAKKWDKYVLISVADEGKGIPEDQIDAIFEKFYSIADEATRNIGLGLAIAKAVAELHHGRITAENRPIKGAIFSVFLPFNNE